jgi:2-dehydro-3-deoxy-D-arabinonate dehydratase
VPLCRYVVSNDEAPRFGLVVGDRVVDLEQSTGIASLAQALKMPASQLRAALQPAGTTKGGHALDDVDLRAPIDEQEVWAAGVTYLRSRDARMEESTQRDVYDQVYDADRPELFLKATPNRVAGPNEPIAIRGDSGWDVPEPELAILLNAHRELIGYTIGNDVSSRSIEGENPLYLPQAKVYSRSAALGPVVFTVDELPDASNLDISLTIRRDDKDLFHDMTSTSRMHRTLYDLIDYLHRFNEFPNGVYLMTGTGIVPPLEFTLQAGDEVSIVIEPIGVLVNSVVRPAS